MQARDKTRWSALLVALAMLPALATTFATIAPAQAATGVVMSKDGDDDGGGGDDDNDDDDDRGRGGSDDDDDGDDDNRGRGRGGSDDDDNGGGNSPDDDGTPDQGRGDNGGNTGGNPPSGGNSPDDDGTPDQGRGDNGGGNGDDDVNELEVRGRLAQMPASGRQGTWTVGGRTFTTTAATRFVFVKGRPALNVCVEIEANLSTPTVATKIQTKSADDCAAR